LGGFHVRVTGSKRQLLCGLANAQNQLSATGNQSGVLTDSSLTFTANDPQYFWWKIDREKAKSLKVPLSEIQNALQVYMGRCYVNDFDFNNRAYRVYIQAKENSGTRQRYRRVLRAVWTPER